MTEHVQTKKEIEAVLAERGLKPRKRFGQHFLIDGNLMRRLVDSAEVGESDLVLEVGPGTGGLTDLLATRAGKVVCAEIDRDMCDILRGRFGWDARVTIVEGDVLRNKHHLSEPINDVLNTADTQWAAKLVANLPYQIATPLVMNLLVDYPRVRRLCFTVQAEVGERIMAKPGGRDYGPLAIVSQSLCEIRQVARIGPQAFWPQPAVDSVMLRIDVAKQPFPGEMPAFAAFVRGFFDHRRKQLRAAAAYVLTRQQIEHLADSHDLQRRPEDVPVAEWALMYRGISELKTRMDRTPPAI
jgi:16S rRNA (adenine1518-N6/adenine1519-N6)-dimethyltransferase